MMKLKNENISDINELKNIYTKERKFIKDSFFLNYSGIKNNKQNSNLIDKIIKNFFYTK